MLIPNSVSLLVIDMFKFSFFPESVLVICVILGICSFDPQYLVCLHKFALGIIVGLPSRACGEWVELLC